MWRRNFRKRPTSENNGSETEMENPVVSIPGCVWETSKRIKMHTGVWYGTLKQTA
jgi:hypothetical protein